MPEPADSPPDCGRPADCAAWRDAVAALAGGGPCDEAVAVAALGGCAGCRRMLDEAPTGVPPPVAFSAADAAPPDAMAALIGDAPPLRGGRRPAVPPADAVAGAVGRVDRYDLLTPLGRGAAGTTFRAWDARLGRTVALKVLDGLDGPADRVAGHALDEARRAAAGAGHPGLVPVYDAGVDAATGLGFIAAELVEGETLRDRLSREATLPTSDALSIAAGVLDALAFVHPRGVVHRDVKPSNLMLDRGERVRLLDFGIARAGPPAGPAGRSGTPAYMPPEQAAGRDACDGRADLYAVGVCLYEMLTGDVPVSGPTDLSAVPAALRPLLARALRTDPAGRFQSADEMAAAVRAFSTPAAVTPADAPPYARTPGVDLAAALAWDAAFAARAAAFVRSQTHWFDGHRRQSFEASAGPVRSVAPPTHGVSHPAVALGTRRRWDVRQPRLWRPRGIRVEAVAAVRTERFLQNAADAAPADADLVRRVLAPAVAAAQADSVSLVVLLGSPTGWADGVNWPGVLGAFDAAAYLFDGDAVRLVVDPCRDAAPPADEAFDWLIGQLAYRPAVSLADVAQRFGGDGQAVFRRLAARGDVVEENVTRVGKVLRRRD